MTARATTSFPATLGHAITRTGRMGELDAVRGIAALVVVLHHCWQTLLPDQNTFPFVREEGAVSAAHRWAAWVNLSPLKLLFSGHPAVGVFFVLSGLVLTRQLQARATTYPQFVVRRVFRLWVPFALVILMAAGLCALLAAPLPGLPWLNGSWNEPVSWQLLAGHLLMLGTTAYVSLDNPMWSLVHEMRISLLFPLLLRLARRQAGWLLAGAAGLFAVLSITSLRELVMQPVPQGLARELLCSGVDTARYGLFFVLGMVLALKGGRISAWLRQQSPARRRLGWLVAFTLLAVPYLAGYLELLHALGATLMLALCRASMQARRLLGARLLSWLGKVSYSLYLVHLLVLLSLVHLLVETLPLLVILGLAVLLSLGLAELCHRLIEEPANRCGKRLAGWLRT